MEGEARGHNRDYSVLLSEVVNGDGSIVPTLRAVFDSRNCDVEGFVSALNDQISVLERQIEVLCSGHSQGFVDAIDEVRTLKDDTRYLKSQLERASVLVNEAGTILQQSQASLVRERRRQYNILVTIKALNECVPVLRLYTKIGTQLQNGQYYSAIKTLEELESTHIAPVLKYSFGRKIHLQTVFIREQVQRKAFHDMHTFLADARKKAEEIGEVSMKRVVDAAKKLSSNTQLVSSDTNISDEMDLKGDDEEAVCSSDTSVLSIDFAPLYSCWHICTVLGVTTECAAYYKVERRKQSQLVIHPPNPLVSVRSIRDYFSQLCGFFLIEETVLSTTEGLISKQYVDELWHLALTTIATVMDRDLMNCTTASMFREVKDIIVTFRHTLMAYDFSVGRIVDILLQIRERYQSVLFTTSSESLRGVLFNDNYTPIVIETAEKYETFISDYPCTETPAEDIIFPFSFTFSDAVPNVYFELKQFIYMTFIFVRDIGLSNTEVDELLRQSTNQIISKVLSNTMVRIVQERTLSLMQLTQISVNTAHLEDVCRLLEKRITSLTRTRGDSVRVTRLFAAADFKDARSEAEVKIIELLVHQIDEFLDLADYSWAPAKPITEASSYIFDLLAYLTTKFTTLTNLPREVAINAYFHTCKHLCKRLLELVQSSEIKKVNLNGIRGFNHDVKLCEEYALSSTVVDSNDGLLADIFVSLRELVDVFLNNDLEAYVDEATRKQKYSHLPPRIVLLWLEKFDDSSDRRFFKSSKDRKSAKFIDGIIKRLRAQLAKTTLSESHEGEMMVGTMKDAIDTVHRQSIVSAKEPSSKQNSSISNRQNISTTRRSSTTTKHRSQPQNPTQKKVTIKSLPPSSTIKTSTIPPSEPSFQHADRHDVTDNIGEDNDDDDSDDDDDEEELEL
eukprot:m.136457 g.136457  ORF g.136457 m.136457 type:complete len:904 (+) comp13141_c0_seq1:131-2842(+)